LLGTVVVLSVGRCLAAAKRLPFGTQRLATSEESAIVRANRGFAVDLYGQLAGENQGKNLFFSPYSISSALAMTSAGAKGNTAKQMAKTLHLDLDAATVHPEFASLAASLKKEPAFELVVANALWGQQGYPYKADFLDLLKAGYGSELRTVDFGKAESARAAINQWTAAQTKDKVQELIAPGLLTPTTRLVLTNAIYFKAKWQFEFEKKDTADEPFSVSRDKTVPVPTMHQPYSAGYFEDQSLQAVELPYLRDSLSMVLVVPRQVDGLAAVEKDLSSNLTAWLDGLKNDEIVLSLPRFKTTCSFRLSRELTALGMTDAFSTSAADFSGMADAEKPLLGEVVHRAYVAVDEEGTEAAAATGVQWVGAGRKGPAVVKVDRPFLFLIRHNGTGTILFIGRVVNPLGT
jgi:serpin B